MSKRKMVLNNLIKNSIAAYFAAIEIHNKPQISYRYENTTLLIVNAWELILKAYIKKNLKRRSIYTKDGHTISLSVAIDYVEQHMNSIGNKEFKSIKENILLLEKYRNNVVHYYNEDLEPFIFTLVAKSALNYVEFLKKYFNKDIMLDDGLFILPIGFKLPFKPEDFLSKHYAKYDSSNQTKEFINSIVTVISNLNEQGINDSVVLGFNIYFESVKKMTNSDILAAITSDAKASANFTRIQKVQITNDKSAQRVNLSDSDYLEIFPLTYTDVKKFCLENIPDFKANQVFNNHMKKIKGNNKLAYCRKLDPKDKNGKWFYSKDVLEELKKKYCKDDTVLIPSANTFSVK